MTTEWRDDTPGWREGGPIELLCSDGQVHVGELRDVDEFFTGEDEVPVWKCIVDGREVDFWSYEGWRKVG